jgi:hypothetical protein
MRRLEETGWTISTVFVQVCFPLVMPDIRFSDDLQKEERKNHINADLRSGDT